MKHPTYDTYPAETAALLQWYDAERRILPWREDPSPYHIWLSEVMLQQTRVSTVIDYYHRFLAAFPDVASLAQAEEEQLLKLWQGLGYYRRILHMHQAAKQVMRDFNGQIPGTPEELMSLTGIGPYAAAAIASIAFGVVVPSVDGNLLRIFARTQSYEQSIKTETARRLAAEYFQALLPADRPGDMNQALMDLGATICLPHGAPECTRCPWSHYCHAHQQGQEERLPIKEEKKARRVQARTVLRILSSDRIAIQKRPPEGLLANLYEFPNEEGWWEPEEIQKKLTKMGLTVESIRRLPPARHIFSHIEWDMIGYEIVVSAPVSSPTLLFVTPEELEERYSLPSAFSAYR